MERCPALQDSRPFEIVKMVRMLLSLPLSPLPFIIVISGTNIAVRQEEREKDWKKVTFLADVAMYIENPKIATDKYQN